MSTPANPMRPPRYRVFTHKDLDRMPQLRGMSAEQRIAMKAVASVLPFRVNNYVLDELIRWDEVPEDPMFQMTFPQPEMLAPEDLARMVNLLRAGAPKAAVEAAAREVQDKMNPHPAGQLTHNVPTLDAQPLAGMQHKYRETVLFFPSHGQTCHAYCTYCFRWAQFVGIEELKFASREVDQLVSYLKEHPEVTSVLFTGGDPLIMTTAKLRRYIEPLLAPELEHLSSIRLGTKATAYWPYRFLTDPDAEALLDLFTEVRRAGRHLALMSHYTHPRELETPAAQAALRRIQDTGAVVRCQSPIMAHINDSADHWSDLWRLQVRLGAIPYYMFMPRDTGPKKYFDVPLARAHEIFRVAYRRVSGLGRTVRGPSMSSTPGKVVVDGVADIRGERVFVLKFIQARDPEWVGIPFFAKYDADASWLDELRPAFGDTEFFYEPRLRAMEQEAQRITWRQNVNQRPLKLFAHIEWE